MHQTTVSKHKGQKPDRTTTRNKQFHLTVGNLSAPLLVINRKTKQTNKKIRDTEDWNNAINSLDRVDIYRLEYATAECIFFSSAHGIFTKIMC